MFVVLLGEFPGYENRARQRVKEREKKCIIDTVRAGGCAEMCGQAGWQDTGLATCRGDTINDG